jgi:hypothetical protein
VNPSYPAVSRRAERRCEYCRAPERIFNLRFEVEHISPQSVEIDNDLANLALACRSCNLFKATFTRAVDPESGESVALFHPRQDVWAEHFALDPESRELRGLTDVGRASIVRLHMNDDFQIEARDLWLSLDLYP